MRWLTGALFVLVLSVLVVLRSDAQALPDVTPPFGGNEPHAAVVNPLNPDNVIVAQCSLRISTDFGRTFGGAIGVGIPPGYPFTGQGCDDVLTFDSQGRLFWVYLLRGDIDGDTVADDLTVVAQQVNATTGALVGNAVDLTPGMFTDDKPWIAADANAASPFADNVYVIWTRLNPSMVMFSRTTNNGGTWSAPTQVSAGGEGFVWPSDIAVAPNGDVYAGYHSDTCGAATAPMFILRDSSGGADLQAGMGFQKTSFAAAVTCNVQDSSGDEVPQTDFWMQGALQPYILPDPVRPGNIYVIANDDPNDNFGNGDDGDVILARSTDNGNSWSISTISHGPAETFQGFPTGAIDQLGNMMAFWYDTRNGATNAGGNLLLDVYATVSKDGGVTWTNDFQINDAAFDPDLGAPCRFGPQPPCQTAGDPVQQTGRIGEYNGAAATDGVGYASWTGNTGAGQQIFFDVFSILGQYPDAFEPNDAINAGVATDLGAAASYTQTGLTINTATDEDFFRVVAVDTGVMEFEIQMNGRISDLDIQVQDQFGNAVGTDNAALDSADTENIAIPVVGGQDYYLRVFAQAGQLAAMNTYSLSIENTAAPAPFAIDLVDASDSGASNSDNLTNDSTPTIRMRLDDGVLTTPGIGFSPANATSTIADDSPGYKVQVIRENAVAGYATPDASPGLYSFTFPGAPGAELAEGLNSITARVVIVDPSDSTPGAGVTHFTGNGSESEALLVTLDTTAPAAPAALDLLASSDSGGINIDNITTIMSPAFSSTAEANSLVRLFANGADVGQAYAGTDVTDGAPGNGLGALQVISDPLDDGVYAMTATSEDLAGNHSGLSAGLNVTIANQVLNLVGATATVNVDLALSRVTGYPGIPGGIVGILGIPTVNLDANGEALTALGSTGNDGITYVPAGADSGAISREGVAQTINFSNVAGAFTIDPLGGTDNVWVYGTVAPETITALLTAAATVQVGGTKTVTVPIAVVESLKIWADEGQDVVDITAYSGVSAIVAVDGDAPTSHKKFSDLLIVRDGSGGAKIQRAKSGRVAGTGAVFVKYASSAVRVDYAGIEAIKTYK